MAVRSDTQAVKRLSTEQLEEAFLALRQHQAADAEELRVLERMAREHLAAIEHPD